MNQIIGESPAFLDLMDHISHAAPMNRPVLVVGERGSGKELIAARLHYLSNRWNRPYQKMNCAALTESLLESELFGYEAGAFTGANKRREGRFEAADGGTLFLDEIATMSMSAQEKLLRLIEYGEFERVGGNDTVTVDVRIIGATNIDLPRAANEGTFRHDLLDRLAFDVLTVPPLRARRDDIPVLANHFGSRMARELEWLQFPGFTKSAMDAMCDHTWPGNIRELRNVVERAVYSSWDGESPIDNITFDPFDSPYRPTNSPASLKNRAAEHSAAPTSTPAAIAANNHLPANANFKDHMAALEKTYLTQALEAAHYSQKAAAKSLGLSYDQLRHLMRKHALTGH